MVHATNSVTSGSGVSDQPYAVKAVQDVTWASTHNLSELVAPPEGNRASFNGKERAHPFASP
jgi:hypothetical protein